MKVIWVHDDGCVESFDVRKVLDPLESFDVRKGQDQSRNVEVFQGREFDGYDDLVLVKDGHDVGTMRVYYP